MAAPFVTLADIEAARARIDADPVARDHASEIGLRRVVGGEDDQADTFLQRARIELRPVRIDADFGQGLHDLVYRSIRARCKNVSA